METCIYACNYPRLCPIEELTLGCTEVLLKEGKIYSQESPIKWKFLLERFVLLVFSWILYFMVSLYIYLYIIICVTLY